MKKGLLFLGLCMVMCESTWAQQSEIKVKKHTTEAATNFLMFSSAAKTTFKIPKNVVKRLGRNLTAHSYDSLLDNSREAFNREQIKACEPNPLSPIDDLLNKLDPCECSAWNNCPGKKCSVEEVCPFDLTIFKITSHQRVPVQSNQLSFRNHDKTINFKEKTGFCWGHATTTQRLNALTIFDPMAKSPFKEGSKEWLEFNKKIIDDIVYKNEAQIIPGFENLYEFSNHPALKNYFGEIVAKIWAKESMNIRALPDVTGLKSRKRQEQFKIELEELLSYGIAPTVVLAGGLTTPGQSHVIIPWKSFKSEEGNYYCYNDNTEQVYKNVACDENIEQEDTDANFSYHAKKDLAEQANSLQKLCYEKFKNHSLPSLPKDEWEDIISLIESKDQEKVKEVLIKSFNNEYGVNSHSIFMAGLMAASPLSSQFILNELKTTPKKIIEDIQTVTKHEANIKIEFSPDEKQKMFSEVKIEKDMVNFQFVSGLSGKEIYQYLDLIPLLTEDGNLKDYSTDMTFKDFPKDFVATVEAYLKNKNIDKIQRLKYAQSVKMIYLASERESLSPDQYMKLEKIVGDADK